MINKDIAGVIVFQVLYLFVFLWMVYAAITRRISLVSRFGLLLFHVVIRLASQATGIVFYLKTFRNIGVFVAYLVLGAEGYFTLVYCVFRFLIAWHKNNLPERDSWLEPKSNSTREGARTRVFESFFILPAFFPSRMKQNPMAPIHALLVTANVVIITGGSYVASAINPDTSPSDVKHYQDVAKITRTTGQAVFLFINVLLLFCVTYTIRESRQRTRNIHPTLILLLLCWVVLIVRGVFGVLQACVYKLSYYNESNFGRHGFTSSFTAIETIFAVLMEWLACVGLNATIFTDRNTISNYTYDSSEEELGQAKQTPNRSLGMRTTQA